MPLTVNAYRIIAVGVFWGRGPIVFCKYCRAGVPAFERTRIGEIYRVFHEKSAIFRKNVH
jgi:hypothetical protein